MMTFIFAEEKLKKRINELEPLRYTNRNSLKTWFFQEDVNKDEKNPPIYFDRKSTISIGDSWEGRDCYFWIEKEIKIPSEGEWVLLLNFGKTGGGNNSGFESLLFINGSPYQGVDSNHKEVFIDKKYNGCTVTVTLRLWTGLEGGGSHKVIKHEFCQAELVSINRDIDGLYYLSDMILKTIIELGENDPNRYTLLEILNCSFLKLNWVDKSTEIFNESVREAFKFLSEKINENKKISQVVITAIGHTHIDVAWLWRLKHTREKAARSFSTVLRLMKQYPEYIFLQTQPQLYKYIKEDYPEIFSQIKKRVEEGRWEVDGAMWIESDCNIPSGESLTRQILMGSSFIKKEFNKDVHYLWLPDVFGYSWALPQILKKSGIETFMTTKISWNQFNRMPHDTFIWRGMDGSEVLTHFITTPDPKDIVPDWARKWFYSYNGQLEPETVLGSYNAYRDKEINSNLLISYGYGDGGGGVNRDMLEKRRAMNKIPGLPFVETGKAVEYFEKLHQNILETDVEVPKWDGELYLEYHRGTYTSQAKVKKQNRKAELMLRKAEMLCSFWDMENHHYPTKIFAEMWEIVLRNQFHDIIPGSSITEVYQDYDEDFKKFTRLFEKMYSELDSADKKLTIFNSCGWNRSGLIKIEGKNICAYKTEDNQILECQIFESDSFLYLGDIKPLSVVNLTPLPDYIPTRDSKYQKSGKEISNGVETNYYIIQWNEDGHLISIFDKKVQREILSDEGNILQLFEDKPLDYDAWDIDIFYKEKVEIVKFSSISILHNGQHFIDISFKGYFGKSSIEQIMRLYSNSRRIDFISDVNWHERQRLLKVLFPVDIRATEATYDIQYGNVKRPTHNNTSWDVAKFETVAHQWADISETDYGVSLLNDCKYGYDIKDNFLRLSLLKGAIYPDPIADIGEHHFVYSLYPHSGDVFSGGTVEAAWDLNDPLVYDTLRLESPKIKIKSERPIMIDAIKKAEDGHGWILRVHEHTGGRINFEIDIPKNYCWCRTNLMEVNEEDYEKGPVRVFMKPYSIETLRIVDAKDLC